MNIELLTETVRWYETIYQEYLTHMYDISIY